MKVHNQQEAMREAFAQGLHPENLKQVEITVVFADETTASFGGYVTDERGLELMVFDIMEQDFPSPVIAILVEEVDCE